MPKKSAKSQSDYKHTWYLREWMQAFDPPRRQADMIRDLGWSRAKASDVYNGQRYTQELIDTLAPWLHVRPFELLMDPKEAHMLRSLRQTIELVHSTAITQEPGAPVPIAAIPKRQAR